jgi:hypothetical protein
MEAFIVNFRCFKTKNLPRLHLSVMLRKSYQYGLCQSRNLVNQNKSG